LGDVEIVSADSRQVYRGMDIGTAKVSAEERARVPHHGLDLVDPDQPFNVAQFQRHAFEALRGIEARRRRLRAASCSGTHLPIRSFAATSRRC
jgi:tRNA dimethylallyltransferase